MIPVVFLSFSFLCNVMLCYIFCYNKFLQKIVIIIIIFFIKINSIFFFPECSVFLVLSTAALNFTYIHGLGYFCYLRFQMTETCAWMCSLIGIITWVLCRRFLLRSTTTMNQVKSNILVAQVFVPRGGKCQFAIKVLNFDGKIPIDMLLLLLLFVCHCRRVVYQVLRAR